MKLSVKQLEGLIEIFTELDTGQILSSAVQQVSRIINAKGCSIFLYDEGTDTITLAETTSYIPEDQPLVRYKMGEGLTGWVFKNRKPLLIQNLHQKSDEDLRKMFGDDLYLASKFIEGGTLRAKSYVAVPIVSRNNKFYGVLRSSSVQINYNKDHLDILQYIAGYISIALENSDLYLQVRKKSDYFQLLTEFGTRLHSYYNKKDLLDFVAEQTAKTFSAETCEIYLRDETQPNLLILRAGCGIPKELINNAVHEIGEGLTGTLVKENRTIRLKNVLNYPKYKGKYRSRMKRNLKYGDRLAFLGIPLHVKTDVVGCLKLYNKIPKYTGGQTFFSEDDEKYLNILGLMLGVMLENLQYLESMQKSAIQMIKTQRLTALGTMAIRLPNEITNALTTARMNTSNLLRKIRNGKLDPAKLAQKIQSVDESLSEAAAGVKTLQEFSTRAGFVRIKRTWEEVIDEGLLFISEETLRKKINIHRKRITDKDGFPQVVVEPNEMIEVIINLLLISTAPIHHYDSDLHIRIRYNQDAGTVETDIQSIDNHDNTPLEEISPHQIEDNEVMSPTQFMLQVAREIVTSSYHGKLELDQCDNGVFIRMSIPVESENA